MSFNRYPLGPTGPTGPQGATGPISPAFKFTRQGALVTDTWLLADGIPSNVVGQAIFVAGSVLISVDVDSSQISTYDVTIYEHDHSTQTPVVTVPVVANYGGHIVTSIPVTTGKNLSARITSGSASDVSVSVVLSQ